MKENENKQIKLNTKVKKESKRLLNNWRWRFTKIQSSSFFNIQVHQWKSTLSLSTNEVSITRLGLKMFLSNDRSSLNSLRPIYIGPLKDTKKKTKKIHYSSAVRTRAHTLRARAEVVCAPSQILRTCRSVVTENETHGCAPSLSNTVRPRLRSVRPHTRRTHGARNTLFWFCFWCCSVRVLPKMRARTHQGRAPTH